MKIQERTIGLAIAALLVTTPVLAQRHGGGRPSGGSRGGSVSHSVSTPRHTSSPTRSYSSPSRPTSSTSRPASSTSRPASDRYSSSSSSRPATSNSHAVRPASTSRFSSHERTASTPANTVRSSMNTRPSATTSARPTPATSYRGSTTAGPSRFGQTRPGTNRPGYASPVRPHQPMPPAHRPIHPAPYFYHPIHHHYIHMHPLYWDPFLPAVVYWPGLWSFCVGYWVGTACSDEIAVRDYIRNTQNVEMINYAISGDFMYALIDDHGDYYLRVYDKADNLLAQHPVSNKYCTLSIDSENGGCWIMKKRDKDPLLFIYSDGELLIYEAD